MKNGLLYELNEELLNVTEKEIEEAGTQLSPVEPEDKELGEVCDEAKRFIVLGQRFINESNSLKEQHKALHSGIVSHDNEKCKELTEQIKEKEQKIDLYFSMQWESIRRSLGLKNNCSLALREGWKVVSFLSEEEKLILSFENISERIIRDLKGGNFSEDILRKSID
ncbi:MAG: hypothetical protein AB1333_04430 [Patescibacteria group bacterium]